MGTSYKQNILMLLIGGNSIANYALIEYFKDRGDDTVPSCDKVVLIYTRKTKSIAENIKKLQSDVKFLDINLEDEYRNLNKIKEIIIDSLKQYDEIKSIHLNYTGGTKPMSIGAFLAVTELEVDEKIYSDISPDDYKLTLKKGIVYPQEGSLLDNVNIEIKEFYLLNNLEEPKYKNENSEIYSEEFCKFLLEKCLYCEKEFFEELWDKKKAYQLNWRESLEGKFIDLDKYDSKKSFKKLQKFIRGEWLEEYLFATLCEIKDVINFTDIAWNIEAKNRFKQDFELDVLVTKGYNIYVFSCTTDREAHIKQKAFEANLRAEQVGGIGAKPILVSLADNSGVEKVKNEMQLYVGKKRFDAIGAEEIKDKNKLKDKLKKVFDFGDK